MISVRALAVVVGLAGMLVFLAACGASDTDQRASAAAAPAPRAQLPDGLADRPGLPPLDHGQAAACVPECTNGRVVPDIPVGPSQTEWFFGGYMTLTFDGVWTPVEDVCREPLPVGCAGTGVTRG